MARRAALIVLAAGLLSCGSSNGSGGDWSCHWQCNSSIPPTSGNATYPASTSNPTQQCTTDHGTGCSDFNCGCNQN